MNEKLTEQERADRRTIVEEMMSVGNPDKLEIAYLEAFARGDLSLDELRGRIIGRGDAKAEQVMAEATEAAETFMAHSAIEQASILRRAGRAADAIREDMGGPAERLTALLAEAESPEAGVRDLILHGTEEQIGLVAKYMAAAPGGHNALDGTIRQILRDMAKEELSQTWPQRIRPMLIECKMLPADQFQKLDADVKNLLNAYRRL